MRALCAIMLATAPAALKAQVIWAGGFPNDNFSNAANWQPGLPANDGSEDLLFNSDSDDLVLDTAADFLGIQLVDNGSGTNITIKGTNTLSIGSDGLTITNSGGGSDSFQTSQNVNVILTAAQTWYAGCAPNTVTINGKITDTGGSPLLTLSSAYNSGATFNLNSSQSTFTGGVYVTGYGTGLVVGASSTGTSPSVTSGPLGTGNLQLGEGTHLTTNTSLPVTIGNSIMLGDDTSAAPVTLGGYTYFTNPGSTDLTLSGPISLYSQDEEFDVGSNSRVTLSGVISGATYCLDFGGQGSASSSLAIVTGPVSVSRLDLEDSASVIFDGGPSQLTLGYSIGTQGTTYVGLGASYAGSVGSFLASGSIYQPGYSGTVGLDTVSGSNGVFSDNIDLGGFTSGSFVGLGSATSAVVAGVITPPGGLGQMFGATYPFGGGGGILYVQSGLQDSSYYDGEVYTNEPNNVLLSPGNAPLKLVLQGPLNYTGTTTAIGGAIVIDTAASTSWANGSFNIGNNCTPGYIGYTELAGLSAAQFLSLVNASNVNGVVGFDSTNPGSPRTVPDAIDLLSLPFSGNTFIGTATSAILTGVITPAFDGPYQFAGVHGGQLQVASDLPDVSGEPTGVVIGLAQPLESFGSQSSVTLEGNNTYTGQTTLNSGYLYVTGPNSIGSGPLYVPQPSGGGGWAATLAALGGTVTLANDINVPNSGLALNTGSTSRLILNGAISGGFLGIFGPVDLGGANTYSNGTNIGVGPSTVINIATDTGLGYGGINANGGILNFLSASPALGGLQLNGTTVNFSGSPIIASLQMAQSTINFADLTNPVVNGLSGGGQSAGNVINLGTSTGATLTLNLADDPDFNGTINGPGALVVTGNDLNLSGANTYQGGTTVGNSATIIASSSSALGTGPVTVTTSGTLVTNTGVTITNPITLNAGGSLAGFGTFAPSSGPALLIQNGTNLIPGAVLLNSSGTDNIPAIGTLHFGGAAGLTFGSGGNMAFSVNDANGAAGIGYSTVQVTGGLTLTNSGSPFNIVVFSFDPSSNVAGANPVPNFNPAQSYQWTMLSTTTGITGFVATDFNIATSFNSQTTFLNSTGSGSFFVSEVGNDLMLNFTPVPEPSTWMMMATGLSVMAAAVRRRRR